MGRPVKYQNAFESLDLLNLLFDETCWKINLRLLKEKYHLSSVQYNSLRKVIQDHRLAIECKIVLHGALEELYNKLKQEKLDRETNAKFLPVMKLPDSEYINRFS